ncbi:MAG: CvpA family protein [Anaerolineae bacterium]|nr:CvpA family protein [Anaerolineae bacterium]
MVSLTFMFWMFVVLFGIIGAMRGWAKELLVAFSMILALTLLRLLETFVPFIKNLIPADQMDVNGIVSNPVEPTVFWLRVIIVIVLVFFGYQTVALPRFASKAAREKLQDMMLGFFFGAFNGYLVVGTLWFFMYQSAYPFANYILPPDVNTPMGVAAQDLIPYLAPRLFGEPVIYFAVVLAFIFVLVVFI